ncbi:MAG: C69 family dipeptidase [Clostridia bacterium]|nr:C69 family dipeptidase [Clostridia bacterium]
MKKLRLLSMLALMIAVMLCANSALACTTFLLGTEATTDGSTIATHNDDSTGADFRLWIIPSMEGGEGIQRDLVMDSHNYGDFGDYPNTKDYGSGTLINQMDQPEATYAYLHSRYSFINEKGVAMGESTFNYNSYDEGSVYDLLFGKNTGIIDCWNAQDIALERAATAREACEVMGKLCEDYGWYDLGETINVCDGNEAWVFEAYGQDLWAAVRIPADSFFVAANRARIAEFDFDDTENYICSPNLKSFAIEHELWSEDSGEPFSPADIYAPFYDGYSTLREWRALSLVAPSLGLEPGADRYPLYVVPEKKLSVRDVFDLAGDYYQGTDYDVSRTAYAGDFGNPLNFNTKNGWRTINMYRTCYLMLANIKGWLPDELKCLVWYGYGAPHSTFITPLWASQSELPDFYDHGSRYEKFDRTSGWWINTYVQDLASRNYDVAIEMIKEVRDERFAAQIEEVSAKQEEWAARIETEHDAVMEELTKYACDTANAWFEDWLDLGDQLVTATVWSRVNKDHKISGGGYSDWYKEIMDSAPMKPVEEPEG